jgi:NADPH-dependent 2,4-dienoyl-CoA reductase/sulfur reductase-like enzyme
VTIVEKGPAIGEGMSLPMRPKLLYWFEKKGVVRIPDVKEYLEITEKGLTIIDKDDKKVTLAADTIIPALPFSPNLALYHSLQDRNIPEVYTIGDCKEPGFIHTAVQSAMLSAIT